MWHAEIMFSPCETIGISLHLCYIQSLMYRRFHQPLFGRFRRQLLPKLAPLVLADRTDAHRSLPACRVGYGPDLDHRNHNKYL